MIREVKYPEWLSNVIVATKEGTNKLQMCIDFQNINDAYPKDSYHLPSIDHLVDSTVEYGLLSFLDAFNGYHQIRMSPKNEEETHSLLKSGHTVTLQCPLASEMSENRIKG